MRLRLMSKKNIALSQITLPRAMSFFSFGSPASGRCCVRKRVELDRTNSAKASFVPAAEPLPLSLEFRVTTAYP